MYRKAKAALLIGAIFVSLVWTVFAWRQQSSGGSANNGYTGDFGEASKSRVAEKRKFSKTQIEQITAAKMSSDMDRVYEIMEADLTPEQRRQSAELRQDKERRVRRAQENAIMILGEEEYQRLLDVKKRNWKR